MVNEIKGLDLGDLDNLAGDDTPSVLSAPAASLDTPVAPASAAAPSALMVLPQLTDAEKKQLDAEAVKEVQAKLKTQQADEYKKARKKELEQQARAAANVTDDGEDLVDIRI